MAPAKTKHLLPPAGDLRHSVNETGDNYSLELQHFSRPQLLALLKTPNLPQTVTSGPMIRNQIFSSYLSAYFPRNKEHACDIDMPQFIISSISVLPQKSSMLDKALSALSCVFLGKIRHDEQFLQHGFNYTTMQFSACQMQSVAMLTRMILFILMSFLIKFR